MTSSKQRRAEREVLPTLPNEALYIGVDIGKFKHVAGFLSKTLLERHKLFDHCPAFVFEQSREGFRAFVQRIQAYCPLEQCFILMEQTGHYHRPLLQYLLELDLPVFVIHVQRRQEGMVKTDKRDALGLANQLYTQLELGAQVTNTLQAIRRALPPSEAAAQLKGLMRHRYELVNEATQRKNKLTAICDELFSEFTQVFKDPNAALALDLRERFPIPTALAVATSVELRTIRRRNHPSEAQFVQIQQLAGQSIGTKNPARQDSLVVEQTLLIQELRLLQNHLEQLEEKIGQIVEKSREGQILTSIPPIGPLFAASIIATIGSIGNFEDAAHLKSYFGWAPIRMQTGVSFDRTRLTKAGSREMKKVMFLVAWKAVQMDTEWAKLKARLAAGMEISRRRYNKLFRLLLRMETKLQTLIREWKKYEFTKIGKSALGTKLSWEMFIKDENSACFIAYYVARCNLRSEFTIKGQQKPFDDIAELLFSRCRTGATTHWWAIAHVYPHREVLQHLNDEQQGELLGTWFTILQEIAALLEETWERSDIKRETMIVRRGNDSSTWNITAGAWNRARDHRIALLYALGMEMMLDEVCPGKVLRLMAADVVAWHYRAGGTLDPNTVVWNELPLPWEVLLGGSTCMRQMVEAACLKHGLDPEKSGWTIPRPRTSVAAFRPTPELVHGVTVGNPYLATFWRKAGFFSGKHIKPAHLN